MFIDASAIIAIVTLENDADELLDRLEAFKGKVYVSPIVKFEATMGLARKRFEPTKGNPKPSPEVIEQSRQTIEEFVKSLGAQEISISADIGKLAIKAAATYGKAIGHKADLNFGDCFTHACTKAYRLDLLYKGNDFTFTDLA